MKSKSEETRRQRGGTMVETAIVMVLFLLLYFGIIGFGRVIRAYSWTSHISREAARWACVRQAQATCTDGTCPATQAVITNYVKSHMLGLNPSDVNVTASFPNGNLQGNTVTVTVTYSVTKLVPFVSAVRVGSSSTMAISQ